MIQNSPKQVNEIKVQDEKEFKISILLFVRHLHNVLISK